MEYIKRKVNKCWMRRVRLYIIVRTCIVYTRTTLATEKVSMIIYQRLGGLGTNVNDFELVARFLFFFLSISPTRLPYTPHISN